MTDGMGQDMNTAPAADGMGVAETPEVKEEEENKDAAPVVEPATDES